MRTVTWRRLERNALRAHRRDLQSHLRELAETRPSVLHADASWMSGVVSLQLSGHRLLLSGVKPSTAWDLVVMAHVMPSLELRGSGRYGPFWWITLAGEREQVVLATHLQLTHDRRRPQEAERDLPVLSGAS